MTTAVFHKARAGAPPGFFRCEAAGLRWLSAAGGARVAEVIDVGDDHLVLERLTPAGPTPLAAEAFGRALAVTHDAGAPAFGTPPDGWSGDGFFGPLDAPLPMPSGHHRTWGTFYARRRLEPAAAQLHDVGRLGPRLRHDLETVAGLLEEGRWDDGEAPARLHGDLWSGNVMWTPSGVVLVDPAAHGGHRLTDLAMLHLFGLPHLEAVVDAYEQVHAGLPSGWRRLLPLHQLYPVAVHAVLFGGGYVRQVERLAAHCAREL